MAEENPSALASASASERARLQPERWLSHIEFVHPPGARDRATALLSLLGFSVEEVMGGRFIVAQIDPATHSREGNANYLAGSEVRPEQWAFDEALAEALSTQPLATAHRRYEELLLTAPQCAMHFGIHYASLEAWETIIAAVGKANGPGSILEDHVRMTGVFRPGEPGSIASIYQAFLWTDVIASGSLALGQRIELSASASKL